MSEIKWEIRKFEDGHYELAYTYGDAFWKTVTSPPKSHCPAMFSSEEEAKEYIAQDRAEQERARKAATIVERILIT